jgi:putative ABC transport system permease protein
MFRNYLKTSLRFFAMNRGFSLLNIAGLSIGTLCCIYILVYAREQYSYDRSFADAGRLYRVTSRLKAGGNSFRLQATTPPALANALEADFSDKLVFTQIAPTIGAEEHLIWYNNKVVYEKEAYVIDRHFFDVFNFRVVAGSPDSGFARPGGVILSKLLAEKLFGKSNPVGKDILVQNSYGESGHVVCGVVESPGKSSIHANIFFTESPRGFGQIFLNDGHWLERYFAYTFVKLNPGTSADDLEQALTVSLHKQLAGQTGVTANAELQLQPITRIHTSGSYESEMDKTISGFFLALLIGIGALIQLIACINFMNLATARASKRAKEVGIRKVIGADNKGLLLQFLVESSILSVAAVFIALPVLIIVLPWINQATGADIPRTTFSEPAVWGLLVGVALVTGLLAGSYPAFYLSDFQAARVIKGDYSSHISVAGLRRSLVVFQFVLSIVLIVGMIVIRRQLDFIKNKDLGFNKDKQLVFTFHTRASMKCANYFAMSMRQYPGVKNACLTDNYPGARTYKTARVYRIGNDPSTATGIKTLSSDEYFLKTMEIPLISGRDLRFADTGSVLINQSLARGLGLDEATAAGRSIASWDGERYTIAGVMKDFNYQSLHDTVAPFMVVYKSGATDFNHLIIKANSTQYSSLLSQMEAMWKQRVFVGDFDCRFLSDEIDLLYKTEIIMSRIINSFTIMAVVISCLGLFGLAAFNAEQRTKEIGIRKVMGASVAGIVQLLSVDFLKLIGISFLIGIPIAWLVMNRWLTIFVYHIQIPWWIFGVAGGSAVVAGMTVVSFQAARAAVVNPVESLRAV